MRYLYNFLFYLALPLILIRLFYRSRRLPEYRKRLAERFGFYPKQFNNSIWVHAVSVGEVLAAVPLIKAILARYPTVPVIVTTMTPTGAARVQSAFGDKVTHYYIPYDMGSAVTRFINTINPQVAIIMETELWPNLFYVCKKKQIPLCLINARLSEKSARGYKRIAGLAKEMLQTLQIVASVGKPDADRFIELGATPAKVSVTGNIKFDIELPANLNERVSALRQELGKDRFIWIAASTHEGEEEMVLAAHKKIRAANKDALLILTPRHPDRFDRIAKLCEEQFITVRRSLQQPCTPNTEVYLADTMGELLLMYGVSDLTFVGGSLIPRGGHNILEPGALGKPMLTGPHLFNFAEISDLFFHANALTKVANTDELTTHVLQLMRDINAREQMGKEALQVISANRGALGKQLDLIARYIDAA